MAECMEGFHQHVDVCNRAGRRRALADLEGRLPDTDMVPTDELRALIEEVRRG